MRIKIPPEVPFGAMWAGLMVGRHGEQSYHLAMLPEVAPDAEWRGAMTWAQQLGGELPTYQEYLLLEANLGGELHIGRPYWTCEEFNKVYAHCYRRNAPRDYFRKSLGMMARAIVRVSLS